MDTPTIAAFYREADANQRKALLEQSIEAGEDQEANEVRKELWNIRYQEKADHGDNARADGFLALWMVLEFNRGSGNRLFGTRGIKKELRRHLDKMKQQELREKGPLYEEILYREWCHAANLYMELAKTDKNYNSVLFGIMSMDKDKAKDKLRRDVWETAVQLPQQLEMEQEFEILTRAAKDMYEVHFPGEGGLA